MNRKDFIRNVFMAISISLLPKVLRAAEVPDFRRAGYMAGYMKISKQILKNIAFLQEWLPKELLKEYNKNENITLYYNS